MRTLLAFVSIVMLAGAGLTFAAQAQQNSASSNSTSPSANTSINSSRLANATAGRLLAANNSATTVNVSILPNAQNLGNHSYSPNPVNVPVGGTVHWTNNDSVMHTVTSGNGSSDPSMGKVFDSGLTGSSVLKPSGTFFHTFQSAGTYQYFCQVHPTMVGRVIVGGATSAVPEFPAANIALAVLVAIIGAIIILSRIKSQDISLGSRAE